MDDSTKFVRDYIAERGKDNLSETEKKALVEMVAARTFSIKPEAKYKNMVGVGAIRGRTSESGWFSLEDSRGSNKITMTPEQAKKITNEMLQVLQKGGFHDPAPR